MKQILQSLKTGGATVVETPCPAVQPGQILIRSTRTLISAGTERMLVEFGKAGWIDKARQQPDKVRLVLDKIKTDGLAPTLEAVFNKLDQPLPLGYCNVGVVLETGPGVAGFAVGDRVASSTGVSGVHAGRKYGFAETTTEGSIGVVHYFANGCKAFPKERLEIFAAGRVLQLDNFRKLTGFGWPGFKTMNLWRQCRQGLGSLGGLIRDCGVTVVKNLRRLSHI